MNWKAWFSIGYGPQEFHRDRHIAWVVLLTYLVTRLPQIKTYDWAEFKTDAWTVGSMVVITLAKSFLTDSTPPDTNKTQV